MLPFGRPALSAIADQACSLGPMGNDQEHKENMEGQLSGSFQSRALSLCAPKGAASLGSPAGALASLLAGWALAHNCARTPSGGVALCKGAVLEPLCG